MTAPDSTFARVPTGTRAVVLVEGASDQAAVATLAERLGRRLADEGVVVVPMGGVHAIGQYLMRYGPQGAGLRVAGLYDVAEESIVRRGLARAGFGSAALLTRAAMEQMGFCVCVADLEDELIRALGPAVVETVIADQGELGAFRTFQRQPAWRGRRSDAQLRRFMGSGSTRKVRYGRLLVEALDLDNVPRPLHQLLAHVP